MCIDRGAAENQAYANGYDAGYKQGVADLDEVAKANGFLSVRDAIEQAVIMEIELGEALNDYVIPDVMRMRKERMAR